MTTQIDIGKYNLIFSAPNSRTAMEKNEAESSPSLTTILQALEDKRNAANLYCVDTSSKHCNYMLESLSNIKDSITKMRQWIIVNFEDCMVRLNNEDLSEVITKLGPLETDLKSVAAHVRKITKNQKKKLRKSKGISNSNPCSYNTTCNSCKRQLVINKNGGFDELEMHSHVAKILSQGNILEPFEVIESELLPEDLNALENKPLSPAPSFNEELNGTIDRTQNYRFSRYCTKVCEALFPSDLYGTISKIEQQKDFYTIRSRIPNEIFDCLLCLKASPLSPHAMFQHVNGRKHLSKFNNTYEVNRAINFHNVFSRLVEKHQIHQLTFRPGFKFPFIHCNICYEVVDGTEIVNHIEDEMHMEKFVKRCQRYHFYDEITSTYKTSEGDSFPNQDPESNNQVVVKNKQRCKGNFSNDFHEASTAPSELDIDELLKQWQTSISKQYSSIIFSNTAIKKEFKTIVSNAEKASSSTLTPDVIAEKEQNHIESASASSSTVSTQNKIADADTIIASTSESTPSTSSQENGVPKDSQKSAGKTQRPSKHHIIPAFKLNPENMFDLLENRLQVHLDFMDEIRSKAKEGRMHCTMCMLDFPKSERSIKNHITHIAHKKNARDILGGPEYVYYCDLCFKTIGGENKWEGHLMNDEHKQRLDVIQKDKEPRGGLFTELECTNCKFVMFGNKNTINKHRRGTIGRDKPKKPPKVIKLPNKIVDLLSNDKLFNIDINKLNNDSEAVLNLLDLSNKCCAAIEKALEPYYGLCKAYPFGSRVSGLGNSISDLDVFVDTGSMFDGEINQDAQSQAELVKFTAQILRKHKDFIEVCPIPQARTPIVQVLHKVTGLDCDLSFRHGLSVENTEYLRLCISVQPKMKSLILFVKKWANLCLSHKISTYALSMMAIFFMQSKGLLPSVKQLREIDPTEPNVIAGWKTYSFNKPISELTSIFPPTEMSIKDLLQNFFDYYIIFPFATQVVCPLLGRTVPKVDFHEENAKPLPEEMKVYVERVTSSEDSELFRSLSPMCVQDPFDLSHNVTKAVSGDNVVKFVTLSKLSSALLTKTKPTS